MRLADLPDNYPVCVDTEGSGLHPDDGARISAVSFAFRVPDDNGMSQPNQPMIWKAVAFDQGISHLPLGDKVLNARTIKRLSKWPDWALDEDAGNMGPDRYVDLIRQLARLNLIWHNAKFDLTMFRVGLRGVELDTGIDLEDQTIWDTQLAQRVLEPNEQVGLKPTAVRLRLGNSIGVKEGMEDDEAEALKPWLGPRSGKNQDPRFDLVPWSIMGPYAKMDAALTLLLWELQWELTYEEYAFMLPHIRREKDLMKVLYRMEGRGVAYDQETGFRMEKLLEVARERVAQRLPFEPTPNKARKFFFGPVEEGGLGHVPFSDKVTEKKGDPQVDDEVITRLATEDWDGQAVAKIYQEHEGIKSAMSKWYSAWTRMVGTDGRIRTVYSQANVVSGRLAAKRFQAQAIPHDYQLPKVEGLVGVRDLFYEDKQCPCGCGTLELWEFDVSQAEIRIATAAAQCRPMLEGIQQGMDSHTIACLLMFGDRIKADGFGDDPQSHPEWEQFRQVAKRAQPLDEPIATPSGWKPMGEIKAGDLVLGLDGTAVKVVAIPYRGVDEVWEVRTKSGRVVRCCGDHLWTVKDGRGRYQTLRTRDLRLSYGRETTWYLPPSPEAQFDPVDLPIDPYLLGVLIGDGSLIYSNPKWYSTTEDGNQMAERIASRTPDTIHAVPVAGSNKASRFSLRGGHTKQGTRLLGLDGSKSADKFIPEVYMRGSVEQRYELLRGLMDTDGCATKNGGANIFNSTSKRLVDQVAELVRSLGGVATVAPMHKSRLEKGWNEAWFVHIRTPRCPFALERKVERWKAPTLLFDRIESAEPTGEMVEQQCITVDTEEGLYLTKDYAITHNCNLGILYGAGVKVIQEQLKKFANMIVPMKQVSKWIDDWKAAFPEMVARQEKLEQMAIRLGYVKLVNGRQRYFSAYEPLHKAFNQEIQGSLAEVMKDIMIEVENRYPDSLLLQTHDSLTMRVSPCQIKAGVLEEIPNLMSRRYEQAFTFRWKDTGEMVTVPFRSDAKRFGRHPEGAAK